MAFPSTHIERTSFGNRLLHWTLVCCFFLVALSGLSWFFPSFSYLSGVLGTPQLARILHPFLGIVVFALLMGMLWRFMKHNIFVPTDMTWIENIVSVLLNQHDKKLHIGKYNAGQKFLFWSLMGCICVLLVTGIVLWRAYFAQFFPIFMLRYAALIHSAVALCMILLVLGHIYMGIWVRGSVSGMISGKVPRSWAKQHHDRWYADIVAKNKNKEMIIDQKKRNLRRRASPN